MHPAELPLDRIQEALGADNPIKALWIQNPTDGTGPLRGKGVVITFQSKHWVDATGKGQNVAEASQDLLNSIEKSKLCRCGHLKTECYGAS